MRVRSVLFATLWLSLTLSAGAKNFYLKDQWRGEDFFERWNWFTDDDPTHGRVNYVGKDEVRSKNLSYVGGSSFIMRADDRSVVDPSARGRDSVRISSQNTYDEAIIVLDLKHMPAGCATWPAFRTKTQAGPSPPGAVVDIIEGVNLNKQNQATLHTAPNCTIPSDGGTRQQTGTSTSDNCDASVNNNQGCGVLFTESGSWGTEFNRNGGGYYVMSRSRDYGIRDWFWPRNSPNIPPELASGEPFLEEPLFPNSSWGEPAAAFPIDPTHCDYDQHLNAHMIMFSMTFCGDWAGNEWASSGCQRGNGTCADFVNNNPTYFSETYWEINSLRVYIPNVGY